jgi:hypothetical protein
MYVCVHEQKKTEKKRTLESPSENNSNKKAKIEDKKPSGKVKIMLLYNE